VDAALYDVVRLIGLPVADGGSITTGLSLVEPARE
jgi:hypothetical protein